MEHKKEKPLVTVGGRPMIENVLNALKNAQNINEIIVAVSKHTPNTAKMVESLSTKVLETPGKNYISDIHYVVDKLHLSTVLTISADLPLVTSEILDEVIESYRRCNKSALSVMVPVETRKALGLKGGYFFEEKGKCLVPTGINVIDGQKIDKTELKEETLVLDRKEIAVNVNTTKDLEIARRLYRNPTGRT